ncbi:hypothetical protein E2C01_082862 [Portunus trituberculatus]|uniref:Uncharacterized protein n=1 Tax=Portunus trituberculatus TaxID=210409 RepID=A0A5B7IZK6_PORTR|nr:hypothetical protein [Portunus trituberculatus]
MSLASRRRLCCPSREAERRPACYHLGVLGLFTLWLPRQASRRASGSYSCIKYVVILVFSSSGAPSPVPITRE